MPKREFSVLGLIMLVGIWLTLFSGQVSADQCPAIPSDAIQTHGPNGSIDLYYGTKIQNSPSSVIATAKINGYGQKRACGGAACIASGQDSPRLELPEFPMINSARDLSVSYFGRTTIGNGPDDEYRFIYLNMEGTLTFSSAYKDYRINTLYAGYGARIELAPGDYWVDKLYLGANSEITVKGEGKVRLFINSDLFIPYSARINNDTKDSSRLSMVVNGDVHQYVSAKVSALIYAQGAFDIESFTTLNGAVNASQVLMNYNAKINYQSEAFQHSPLAMVCGQTGLEDLDGDGIPDDEDGDRDGDGISNQHEVLLGTDPDDNSDTPADLNANGIPDEMETSSITNQCVAGFSDGLQANGDGADNLGRIKFGYNSQLLKNTSQYLAANNVITRLASWKKSCGDEHCRYTGQSATKLPSIEFETTTSSEKLRVGYRNTYTFSNSETSFGSVNAASKSTLNFPSLPDDSAYRIKHLNVGWGAVVNLAAGDYWIEKLKLGSDVKINIVGEGTVRLFVQNDVVFPWNSRINWEGNNSSDASKLLIYGHNKITVGSYVKLSGFIYSQSKVLLRYASHVKGGVNGADVILRSDVDVEYAATQLANTDFGRICDIDNDGIYDGFDEDLDGDGISNENEVQLGFDPSDNTSTPPDLDGDRIPDALDEDRDGDGHNNDSDVFPDDATEWTDLDGDELGDNKDTDRDGDGISNAYEEQLGFDPNDNASTPSDLDGDHIPDSLDEDRDGDGHNNDSDAFPDDATESSDLDGDGLGDNRDTDRDGDGISNEYETQLGFDPNDNISTPPDLDGDSLPDVLDSDIDGDNVPNTVDAFPLNSSEWSDLDGDGIGDNSDLDRDDDGISNNYETQLGFDPNDSSSTPPDLDGDGIPDSLDGDRDGDNHNNEQDVFPDDASEWADLDGDDIGDNSDSDRDGDGISNVYETQLGFDPNDKTNTPPDLDGDKIPNALDDDRDGDGVNNGLDAFPEDVDESSDIDTDGIGDNADNDRDGDGISNVNEESLGFDPNDASNTPPDLDGDGKPDALDEDRDGDGINNESDIFPDDSTEYSDIDRDGIGDNADTDRDGDGISNIHEDQLGYNSSDHASTPPDLDDDRLPDLLDDDVDGDGHNNDQDTFPRDASEWNDLDGDGIGDNVDADRDGDGISNSYEEQLGFDPNDNTNTPLDLDGDHIPNELDDDRDGDGHHNDQDSFPDDSNEWGDLDGDGIGDNRDTDRDGDGISNDNEVQLGFDPSDKTNTPPDLDGDGLPDALDDDRDNDGINNDSDAFPDDASESSDIDRDGIGDNSDTDRDGDGISNEFETQLGFDPNDNTNTPPDLDGDQIPDALDEDRDGDSVQNDSDAFPDDASESFDIDNDGIGDNSDADRDGDGISNDHEVQLGFDPNDNANTPPDLDGDGLPDAIDDDRDNDGVNNEADAFPDNAAETADLDSDGIGNNADTDRDGDAISNDYEELLGFDPNDNTSTPADLDGDQIPDALDDDRDGDGINNDSDVFPDDINEWADLDGDGIGNNQDPDRDGDGISNIHEQQLGYDASDASVTPPDLDGDHLPDALDDDRDGDGHNNADDIFPEDASEWADLDGDGIGNNSDTDRDGDGISNLHEEQLGFDSNDSTSTPADLDGDSLPDDLDEDRDGDGVNNDSDAFPDNGSESSDIDNDGIGDNTDTDRDGDGISNAHEEQLGFDPNDSTNTPEDLDGDKLPDELDDDRDGDSVINEDDAFPDDSTESSDLDGDGIGDNADLDRDGDGISNAHEEQLGFDPDDNSSAPEDQDGDNQPDTLDDDRDGDGVNNDIDAFPDNANESSDLDNDGIGDNSDTDRDNDGFTNEEEVTAGTDPNDATDYPDTVAPVVSLNGPDNLTTESDLVALSGQIQDEGYGVERIWATSSRYPGTEFSVELINGSEWTASLPLEIGSNLITLYGEDKAGNRSEKNVSVEREDPDSLTGLNILSPAQNTRVNQNFVIVRGQARSDTPAVSIKVTVAGELVELKATNQVTLFDFASPRINLQEGVNSIPLVLDVDGELQQRTLIVIYEPLQPNYAEPVISLLSPAAGSQLSEESFLLIASIEAEAGIHSIALNNETIIQPTGQPEFFNLREAISFKGETSLALSLTVTDTQQQQTEQTITVIQDTDSPVIAIDQSLVDLPASNLVSEQPYPVSGTVRDNNLSSFIINGTPVLLTPEADGKSYRFSAAVSFSGLEPLPLTLEARDQAGNLSAIEYSLQLSSQIELERILPVDNLKLLSGERQSLQVGARLTGLLEGIVVIAELSDSEGIAVSTVQLTGEATIRSGHIQVPGAEGHYQLLLKALNGAGKIITTTRSNISVEEAETVELAVERMEPAPDSTHSEPNGFISFYFNRPIDLSEVRIEVFETSHGYTYIDNDASGTDVLQAKGYQLQKITRSYEAVPGELSILPGNQVLAFYPQRELAYNSEVFVNVTQITESATEQSLLRSRFNTRPLPTFIQGTVIDQLDQIVAGIAVAIPELGRVTKTNNEGFFTFGFGDLPSKTLPSGRYDIVINSNIKDVTFGEIKSWVNIEEGKRNNLPPFKLPILNRDIPFAAASGGKELSLLGGGVKLDLTDATLQFPDSRDQGDVHVQYISGLYLPYSTGPVARPEWVYSTQPRGVQVIGSWGLDIQIPKINNSWDHVPAENSLVLLVGLDESARIILPVGVGQINNYRVKSKGILHQTQLDVIGYSIVRPAHQGLLQQYINDEISLNVLLAELTAARLQYAQE